MSAGDVYMGFDEHGNAFDAFEPSPEEFEKRARMARGTITVYQPAPPCVQSISSSLHLAPASLSPLDEQGSG